MATSRKSGEAARPARRAPAAKNAGGKAAPGKARGGKATPGKAGGAKATPGKAGGAKAPTREAGGSEARPGKAAGGKAPPGKAADKAVLTTVAAAGAAAPHFFRSQAAFGRWLEKHHATEPELWVGFHKVATGRPSLTWNESVDEALRFGWIDGIRKSLGTESYVIRFTPRREGSIWSAKNIARIEELIAQGVVAPAGRAAFEKRREARSRRYSFEQDEVGLPAAYEKQFRADAGAWQFFQAQPPYYRRTAAWWVISAKREDTRQRRLATLIRDSAAGERIAQLRRP